MIKHFRSFHKDLCEKDGSCKPLGIKAKKASPLNKPPDVNLLPAEWTWLKQLVKNSLKHDRDSTYPSHFADYVDGLTADAGNECIHALTHALYEWWVATQPGKCDMIGGKLPLELSAHATWLASPDRKENDKEHFVESKFSNIRIVPLKFNTLYSFIQVYGDNTRSALRELYLETKKQEDINVEAWLQELRALPKTNSKNVVYAMYHHAKLSTERRCGKINKPVPDPPTYEEFFENVFAVALKRQQGRCAITTFTMLRNLTGRKCFQMSPDRILVENLSYWEADNIQIVCCAVNVTDTKRQQVVEVDSETGISPELFRQYIGED